jgi:hypothetical protein
LIPGPRFGFEDVSPKTIVLREGAELISQSEWVLSEKQSVLLDARDRKNGRHLLLQTLPEHLAFEQGHTYQISFVYRVLACPAAMGSASLFPFEAGLSRSMSEPIRGAVGRYREWTAPEGHVGARVIQSTVPDAGDYSFFVAVESGYAIVLDELTVEQVGRPPEKPH